MKNNDFIDIIEIKRVFQSNGIQLRSYIILFIRIFIFQLYFDPD